MSGVNQVPHILSSSATQIEENDGMEGSWVGGGGGALKWVGGYVWVR